MESLAADLGLPLGTFVLCVVSGFVPVVNAELFLLSTSALASPSALVGVLFAATAGQMVAKSAMYLAGAGVVKLPLGRYQGKLDRYREKVRGWKSKPDLLVFVSASAGFPPFYVVSLLAGSLAVKFSHFVAVGFLGRLMRFAAVLAFPQLIHGVAG